MLADELAELFNPAPARGVQLACGRGTIQRSCLLEVAGSRRRKLLPVARWLSAPFGAVCGHPPAEHDPDALEFGDGSHMQESDEELDVQPAKAPSRHANRLPMRTNPRHIYICYTCMQRNRTGPCPHADQLDVETVCCLKSRIPTCSQIVMPVYHPVCIFCATSRSVPEKSRLRANIELDDETYRGRKTTREAVFGEQGA